MTAMRATSYIVVAFDEDSEADSSAIEERIFVLALA
jgi:hypothetical protein